VWAFEEVFGIPAGHALRQVDPPGGTVADRWEHEEHDCEGKLVAVYESWVRADGGLGFVKYSPNGWVLSVSGRSPRLLPRRVRVGLLVATPSAFPTAENPQQHRDQETA
jgi:hypothetical protein